MKPIFFLALSFFPTLAFCVGYGGAAGENQIGEMVRIAESDEGLSIFVEKLGSKRPWKEYKVSEECPTWKLENDQKIIACQKSGKSPLAGATYKVTTSKKIRDVCKDPAVIYVCVQGCSRKETPKLLVEQPWEC